MSHGITLYTDIFWISPYVFTSFVALHEKGVEFATKPVALQRREQSAPDYRDSTLTARVPAIDHHGFVLAESSAIVEYLEDIFPDRPRLFPEDKKHRARARQILAWIRSDLDALREERPTSTMFYERAQKPLSAAGQAAMEKLVRVAGALVPKDGGALFGEWSIADSDLAFMLHRLLLNGHDVPAHVRAFAEREWARPSVKAFVVRERHPYQPY